MAGEIIPGGKSDVAVVARHGIGEIIKPMIRDIFLLDTWIAGTAGLNDPSALRALKPEEELVLRREKNELDDLAILVLTGSGKKLGYVPEKDNGIPARLMDAGKSLKAKIRSVEDEKTRIKVNISLFLADL